MTKKSIITAGDFIDIYHKIRQKGYTSLTGRLGFWSEDRVKAKWNNVEGESDFWSIPEVLQRWNQKCTGDRHLSYEDYVAKRYFSNRSDLSLLSVGCGSGSREQKFAHYEAFTRVIGIDLAENQIAEAREQARNLPNVTYLTGDFRTALFDKESFDVILFNSSLHHFDQIDELVGTRIKTLLKKDGMLIIFEYVGPNRLQWTPAQLRFTNTLLMTIPPQYRRRWKSNALKNKVYRPGWLRMNLIDPSEAVDSESIMPAIHRHFQTLEEKKVGSDILHILLKDIAHHFSNDAAEPKAILDQLFSAEDRYMQETGSSDIVFGIYRPL